MSSTSVSRRSDVGCLLYYSSWNESASPYSILWFSLWFGRWTEEVPCSPRSTRLLRFQNSVNCILRIFLWFQNRSVCFQVTGLDWGPPWQVRTECSGLGTGSLKCTTLHLNWQINGSTLTSTRSSCTVLGFTPSRAVYLAENLCLELTVNYLSRTHIQLLSQSSALRMTVLGQSQATEAL